MSGWAVRMQAARGEGQGVGDQGLGERFLPICWVERRGAGGFQRQEVGSIEDNLPVPLGDGRSLIILILFF